MIDGVHSTCDACGAAYADHAEYCNACGGTRFTRHAPASPGGPVRPDGSILWAQGIVWLLALGVILGEGGRRDPEGLVRGWAVAAACGLVLGVLTRQLRVALLFAGLGAGLVVLAALIA